MGKLKDIKNSIKAGLEGLQYGDETAFAQVVSDTRASFDTYPAARVVLNGQPNEVSTNVQNERQPEFLIISYVQYEAQDANAEGKAFDVGYDLTDLVVDMLDALEPQDGDGNKFTVITQPTTAGWEIIESSAGNVLGIMATVRIRYSHDIV
jgi:hypothetical protein